MSLNDISKGYDLVGRYVILTYYTLRAAPDYFRGHSCCFVPVDESPDHVPSVHIEPEASPPSRTCCSALPCVTPTGCHRQDRDRSAIRFATLRAGRTPVLNTMLWPDWSWRRLRLPDETRDPPAELAWIR